MNPFHSIDELYFSSANYSLPIQTTTPLTLDQISPDPVMDISDLPCAKDHKSSNIHEIKKWMHRESEKQRRQEISKLCATFRSHLPLAYIKGKRATSDHIHEGTNYIKHLQNNVKKLQDKRDELMKLSNFNHVGSESANFATYVIVHPCLGGIQIKCSYSFKKHAFPLSRVLDIVLKEGLNVINCISTRTDDHRFIHTIQSEGPHFLMNETNYTELQSKLIAAISSSTIVGQEEFDGRGVSYIR
ncbi:transcription factor bHLH36-like isoform X1 [Lotus japonicus]|uniref:transcription factor bHLH36-like isoform X1 n=1 Tax=Lotus japonicus TaxID=34305 RepID=UPI002589C9A5|nr:transcription factor bHLH36-like isoform X1 [Lotus japonicus]